MQQHTLKRGGGMQFISTDELKAEELHHLRADHEAAPDEVHDARWAGVVLERALSKLRAECAAEGKANLFETLSPFLGGMKPHVSYQEVADRMNLGLGAVKTLIYRLRQQFASAVRREIMQTVSAPHEVDDELRRLRGVFARVGRDRRFDHGERRNTRNHEPAGDFARRITCRVVPGMFIDDGDRRRRFGRIQQR
jgi:hypothetical protein